jgi:single-strand DNA-binding protein
MFRKLSLLGNIGQDPELKEVGQSKKCTFSVAVTKKWTDKKTEEKKEKTSWTKVEVWGPFAEVCAKNLKKGAKVYCEGELEESSYENKEGNKVSTWFLRADTVEFV